MWFYIQYEESKQSDEVTIYFWMVNQFLLLFTYQFPEALQPPSYHWSTRKRQGRPWPLVGGVGYRFAVEGCWKIYPCKDQMWGFGKIKDKFDKDNDFSKIFQIYLGSITKFG